jgi:hypothetical protein
LQQHLLPVRIELVKECNMKKFIAIILAGVVCVMMIVCGCTGTSGTTPAPLTPATKTIAPVPSAPAGTAAAIKNATAVSWSGTWATTYNFGETGLFVEVFHIIQNGTYVEGIYDSGDDCSGPANATADLTGNCYGTLNGTANGSRLTGIWSDTDPTGTYTGYFEFEQAANGKTFHGHWVDLPEGPGALKNTTQFWNGVKV